MAEIPNFYIKEEDSVASISAVQLIFQSLPDPIYACDVNGNITSYNKAALALWGKAPEFGRDLWCGGSQIFTPDRKVIPKDQSPMARSIQNQCAVDSENILIQKLDGTVSYLAAQTTLLYDVSNILIGALMTMRQIDKNIVSSVDVKLWQDSVSENEQLFRKMIEEVEDYAIVLLDKDGTIINWNKGAQKIKGYSENDILGKNFRIFYLPKDREEKLPEQLILQAYLHGKAMHEGWRLRSDGSTFWGYIVITAVHNKNHEVIGFSKVTRDLTERKIAEDRMVSYAKDIEEQNKQLENYAQIASHDLQEPIRKIQIFASLLDTHIDDKEAVRRYLDKITTSAARMSTLVKDVLNYSQVSKMDELFIQVDLNEILAASKDDLDLLIKEKEVQIIVKKRLPVINGLAVQLHQLFYNLIGNSIKFCSDRPVIEISWKIANLEQIVLIPNLDSESRYIEISFKDNGFGFEQQYASQAFKMFRRLNTVRSGTGIGLAVCKKVVDNHHGDISVISAPNLGSTFVIYLPYKKV